MNRCMYSFSFGNFSFQLPMGFKIEEATIQEIQSAFRSNELTSNQLVQYYLNAIEKLNPALSAVIEVNPDALTHAQEADRNRNLPGGCFCHGMQGIPVLLKDNIATKDKLNTTSGSFALLGSVVPRDAGVIDRLRAAGAIILGKAGLSEWSNFRTKGMPNGWSARGGYVKNPYLVTTEPGGSSTGSAVSVAANLVTVSLGTETHGSLIDPCNISGVVGIKPTVGLTSRSGVIPISLRQDTVGRAMIIALSAKNKLGFIDGSSPQPSHDSSTFASWTCCNHMVLSWILNALTKELSNSVVYTDMAYVLWIDLQDLFLRAMPLAYSNLNGPFAPSHKQERLMQFLMGHNETYSAVRGQLLLMDPLPTIKKANSLTLQEEKQREVTPTYSSLPDVVALLANNRFHGAPHDRGDLRTSSKDTRGRRRPRPTCDHCGFVGHIKLHFMATLLAIVFTI
ncbi:hypothetical protein HHK36_002967 [Tetracentron sinense]|uniref:Amidase domain-containing protein n=1 Tax=Tetracentron sinense TaxID=13715 RepID=A0A834ZSH0_TETSI|nr:hypothetical protein HHK36_002967 [Tetracentron sinense]